MGDLERLFDRFVRSKGLKITAQRRRILKKIAQSKGHFTAEQLYESLRRARVSISRATVYRTLALLAEGGFVGGVDVGQECRYYERVRQRHEHMVCRVCGRISEFLDEQIDRLPERLAQKHGFKVEHVSVRVVGVCRACRRD